MISVSVVVPTFNEKEIIESQIRKILDVTPNLLEVIVVDDDSPDETWKIVEELGKKDNRVRLIRRTNERGLASAIYDGVSASSGEIVLWLDCDHESPKSLIIKILSSIEGGEADVCTASRYVAGGKELRGLTQRVASKMVNIFASLVLSTSIKDYTAGFVATKRNVFDEIGWEKRGYGEYCIEFLYKALKRGFVVKEVPLTCVERSEGSSKTSMSISNLLKLGFDYGIKILNLKFGS